MSSQVKLCAIAKNEGAYLADWVFHHLHFGFDAIEVWINDTDDTSVAIMKAIGAVYEQVTFKVADKLLEKSLARKKYFQHLAYARMAKRASAHGFSHVALLDLDEYWVPLDFASGIRSFVPEDHDVNVVSFQWWVDVPDATREPFESVVSEATALQPDPHVKSVIRFDERVSQIRTHTARTNSGARLLAHEPFPLVDEQSQQWGSLLPTDYVQRQQNLPPAFVLHAINRSETEYVASLAKGLRQAGSDLEYKTNRQGYVPSAARQVVFSPGASSLASYRQGREVFHTRVGTSSLIRESERLTIERANNLIASAVLNEQVMAELRGPLHGVNDPTLHRRYPGWDSRITWWVDHAELSNDRLRISGWAFDSDGDPVEFAIRDNSGREWLDVPYHSVSRPDVVQVHPAAPPECGFQIDVPAPEVAKISDGLLMARAHGRQFWDVRAFRVSP